MAEYFIIVRQVSENNQVPLSLGETILPVFTFREKAEEFLGTISKGLGERSFTVNTNLTEIRKRIRRAGSMISRYVVDPARSEIKYMFANSLPLF